MSTTYTRPKLEALYETHLTRMNIGKRYWGASLSNVPTDSAHGKVTHKYVSQVDQMAARGVGLFLWGDNSRGKTYTACAVLKAIHQAGYSAYCVMADQLRSIYIDREMFDPSMTVVQRVESVEYLLIEDLGKEYSGKGSGWAELCFENLLRARTRELKCTIITTNLSPTEFGERYKESARAIALENMIAIQVKGEDHRARIQSEIKGMII